MTAYASIIIPTHDRASTLGCAVEAALSQSVRDIEVVIVGDGCTPDAREAAKSWAARDNKVRFLDLPKAPFHGVANRNAGIHAARADRIFYSDDDDLLLPHHVETLGPALDEVDVVDTPIVSVQENGTVELGILDSAHPLFRNMLAASQYKGILDTHLAHRRASYIRAGSPWSKVQGEAVVREVLSHLAADSRMAWRTLQRITALSLPGSSRVGMPGIERRKELESWRGRIERGNLEPAIRQIGSYVFHAFRLEQALHKSGASEHDDLLGHLSNIDMSESQRDALLAARAIAAGVRPDLSAAQLALDDLVGARAPGFWTERIIADYLQFFSGGEVREMLDQCGTRPAVALARFHLGVRTRDLQDADRDAVCAAYEVVPPWTGFFFGLSIALGLMRNGDTRKAWEWSDRLIAGVPASRAADGFWRLRERLAKQLGRLSEGTEPECRPPSLDPATARS